MSPRILLVMLAICACSSETRTSRELARIEQELVSADDHDREEAANDLMYLCCSTPYEDKPRIDVYAKACERADKLLSTSDDTVIIKGLVNGGFWVSPLCRRAIPATGLLRVVQPPWRYELRRAAAWILMSYEPDDDIEDTLLTVLREGPPAFDMPSMYDLIMRFLADMPDERLVQLVPLLQDPSERVREVVKDALFAAGRQPIVIDSAIDPELASRARAIFDKIDREWRGNKFRTKGLQEDEIRRVKRRLFACQDKTIVAFLRERAGMKGDPLHVDARDALGTLHKRCRGELIRP